MLASNDKISFPIIAKLGGEDAVLDILEANSRPGRKNPRPTQHAIRYWKTKREIPRGAKWILSRECEQRGIDCAPNDFEVVVPREAAE